MALVHAVNVLIIACPCAMGLATPLSIMIALNRTAEHGILFQESSAFQNLTQIKAIAFDKTGTLTTGQAQVKHWSFIRPDLDQNQIMQWVASIEAKSLHPLAQAIVNDVKNKQIDCIEVENFQNHIGYGVSAQIQQYKLYIGSAKYMNTLGLNLQPHNDAIETAKQRTENLLFVALDRDIIAMIALQDTLKANAHATLHQLKQHSLQLIMLTGDQHHIAQYFAKQLPIDEVFSEALPNDKANIIKMLQSKYGKVAFVGDGINDAPALAQADVGIAVKSENDVAMETADIVLMSAKLQAIHQSIILSQATMRNIQQNLFWAFIYNLLLIPIAMGMLIPWGIQISPIFAAVAMTFSSIFVILNALRLRKVTA